VVVLPRDLAPRKCVLWAQHKRFYDWIPVGAVDQHGQPDDDSKIMKHYALLLTDVVDSTRIAQEHGDEAFAVIWARHDRRARDLLRTWRGREIDKTDGFLVMFDSVADAAGYAVAYHRAIEAADMPFKARVGLHWGPVALRPNSDADVALGAKPTEVEGLAKATTARVMGIAQGGQTLMTSQAFEQHDSVGSRVQSHGHWRLKGLPEPIELFEVGDDRSPFVPPPDDLKAYRVVRQGDLWSPRREIKHSLPAERDRFIGRTEPLLTIADRFDAGSRLVSILGMGGSGKTRLAVRFAMAWLGDFPGGVWFCDLSQARTLDGVHFAIAQGLSVSLDASSPILQLSHAIAGRGRCLVVLDNFEQVVCHAEDILGPLLALAAQARFIVTTRAVLGIVGEDTLVLDPLSTDEATTLFLTRAKSAKHDFRPGEEDSAAIRRLVQLLDGLPLAIELAAARVRVIAPRALVARMTERFKLLGSANGRRGRQATLRNTLDWSWELLDATEKSALAQISVFEGGFTLESAGAILSFPDAAPPVWTPDVIQWLVDKTLVRRVSDERFGLLESVRDYAAEHLRTEGSFVGSGEEGERAAIARHFRYFASLDESAAVADALAEANNLVAACRRAVAHNDASCSVDTLVGAWSALRLCGPFRVALGLVEAVRAVPGLTPRQTIDLIAVASDVGLMMGDSKQARLLIDEGLRQARLEGSALQLARFTCLLGEVSSREGDSENAVRAFDDAVLLAEAIGDDGLCCKAKNGLGALCNDLGRPDEARDHYESALQIANRIRDKRWQAGVTGNLAMLLHASGQVDEAKLLYEQAIALARRIGHRRWEGNTRCNLGLLHLEQGRSKDAREEFELALSMARSMGHTRLECTVLCNLGIAAEKAGDFLDARGRYEESIAMAKSLGDQLSEGQFRGYFGALLARTGNLAEALASVATGEQMLRSAGADMSLALLLCQKAEVMCCVGRYDDSKACLDQADGIASKNSVSQDSELGRALISGRASLASISPGPPRSAEPVLTPKQGQSAS